MAMESAQHVAKMIKDDVVPPHLKNSVYGSTEDKNLSKNYKYPHDYGGYVEQQYLPDGIKDKIFYKPKDNGYEQTVKSVRIKKGIKNK